MGNKKSFWEAPLAQLSIAKVWKSAEGDGVIQSLEYFTDLL